MADASSASFVPCAFGMILINPKKSFDLFCYCSNDNFGINSAARKYKIKRLHINNKYLLKFTRFMFLNYH